MSSTILLTPNELLRDLPAPFLVTNQIANARRTVSEIIQGKDPRLLVVVGPCSIHDPVAALEYASLLQKAAEYFIDDLFIVMRTYFEKPRTTLGWKGLISDPLLDGSFDVNLGLKLARQFLLDLAELSLSAATEFLDINTALYLQDLITWGAIGARTSESQIHRELASNLMMPIGFKNSTDGNIQIAIDAVNVARHSHFFFSMNEQGVPTVRQTGGNPFCHVVLRGSHTSTNYSEKQVADALSLLKKENCYPRLMIDCSHGNSMKNDKQQKVVVESVANQLKKNREGILGVMIESNLISGKQQLELSQPLLYGQSITDACLSWVETLPLLEKLARS